MTSPLSSSCLLKRAIHNSTNNLIPKEDEDISLEDESDEFPLTYREWKEQYDDYLNQIEKSHRKELYSEYLYSYRGENKN